MTDHRDPRGARPSLATRRPILANAEASRRRALLAELQAALAAQQIQSVLARNRTVILQFNDERHQPSGLTDPQLYIFAPDGTDIATTDGITYHFTSGKTYPTCDPAGAVIAIRSDQRRAARLARDAALRAWL